MNKYPISQSWQSILLYSVVLFAVIEILYRITTHFYGSEGSIHIEILLPAFILGIIMRKDHSIVPSIQEEKVSNSISYFFMLLVGISMPLFIGVDYSEMLTMSSAKINQIPMPGWDVIIIHVLIVTIISNLGKLFPLLFYRDRKLSERLAVSVGMFTRGEVGAGVLFIAIGYHLGGVLLVVSVLAMCLNLLLTGIFIGYAKKLTMSSYQEVTEERV